MPEFNMPIEQDVQGTEALRNRRRSSVFYTPLPAGKTQAIAHNKLFFALFNPASWPIFQGNGNVVMPNSIPASLGTFYWKFHVHYCKVRMPDGSMRDGMPVVCAPKQNSFHVEVLKYGPMFKEPRCRVCEEAVAWWSKFDAEWSRTSYNGQALGNRWDYQREQFTQIVNGNPVLKTLHEEANHWTQQVRWVYVVLDLAKVFGERKLDPDETGVQFEPFLSSKQVFDGLKTLVDTGIRFFDENNPQIVVLTKDTTKGARFAKYSVSNLGPWQVDPAFKAYISSDANLPVITGGRPGEDDAQLLVLSYDEQREFLGMTGEPGSGTTLQQQAQNFNYGANAGTGLPAPSPQPVQPYSPVQPYVPAAAPQPSPVQPYAPPVAPQQMQYAPPVAPVAPQPAAPQYAQAPAPVPFAPPPQPVAPQYAPVPFAAPQPPVAAPLPAPQPIAAPAPVANAPQPFAAPLPPAPVASAPPAPAPVFQPGPAPAPAPAPAPMPAPEAGGGSMPKPRRRGQTNW